MPEKPGYLTDEEYKFVYSNTPRTCVDLVIVNSEGLLLTKRLIPPFAGTWHFPGGRVKYKELIDDALNRIAQAELGVGIKEKSLFGFMEMPNDGEYVHSISLAFLVKLEDGDIKGSEQGEEIQFLKEIPEDTLPYHKEFLEEKWGEIERLISTI